MTRRRTLEHHRQNLAEIRNIMNSMKTLAYLETRKLDRFLAAQQTVTGSIEEAAADLLGFHPETLPESQEPTPLYLLIGSERGFCGDFNHALLRQLEASLQEEAAGSPLLLAVGRKLYTLLEGDARLAAFITGASVTDEVTTLLIQLVYELTQLQESHGVLTVYCLYHGGTADGIELQQLLPPLRHLLNRPPRFSHPPVLNRPPREVLVELAEQYLFATLHGMLYTSLLMENRQRITHLEGAVKHLDDEAVELARKCNALRQEEIIEEIEVILLSAAGLDELPGADN